MTFAHTPVLLPEVIQLLNCRRGGIYLDCTLGGGGHAQGILEKIIPGGRLIGIDRDAAALKAAEARLTPYKGNFVFVQDNYANMGDVLTDLGISQVDGILMDLGVSSFQIDTPERGFTYQEEGPLDMRMDVRGEKTAADLVNKLRQEELAQIIWEYGEERWAKRIAEFIVKARGRGEITTTQEMVAVIKAAIPAPARRSGPHPARRTFQALRIAVNDELSSLRVALDKAVEFLTVGGRLCVISFHSLEDRIVKRRFQFLARSCICPPESPVCTCSGKPRLKVLTRRPVTAGKTELENNPRARSAKLRGVEKLL